VSESPEIPVVHEAQVTAAHVYQLVSEQVIPRLDTLEVKVDGLEGTIRDSGLNGHTPYLKEFLARYAQTTVQREAWATVKADLKHKLRFLAPGKHWLTVLLSAIIGGIGWQLASGHVPLPHL
jgi:hypothetical protein